MISKELNIYFLDILEKYILKLFFWETDRDRIGKIIRFCHHLIMYSLILLYIAIHTIFPSYILLCFLYFWTAVVWGHQVLTGGCIVSKLEQRLIGDSSSYVDPILELFHIPISPESTSGTVIMLSTTVMVMMSFELSARTIMTLRSYFT
jgi:hypothetical protein